MNTIRRSSSSTTRAVRKWLASLGIAALAGVGLSACAQGTQQPATASIAVQGEGGSSADSLLAASARILRLLDTGAYDTLWQETPAGVKAMVQQPRFVSGLQAQRQPLGAVSGRSWSGVARVRYTAPQAAGQPPAGLYANVEVSGVAANGVRVVELVSLRIEGDGNLRFTGYATRAVQ